MAALDLFYNQLKECVEYGPKWLLIKYEILPLIYKHTQAGQIGRKM